MKIHWIEKLLSGFLILFCAGILSADETNTGTKSEAKIANPLLLIPSDLNSNSFMEMTKLEIEKTDQQPITDQKDKLKYHVVLFDGSQMQLLPSRDEYRADLKMLQQTLTSENITKEGIINITTCSGEKSGTRKGFEETIKSVAKKAGRRDFILVVIQGYTTHLDGKDYILPYDTNPKAISDLVRSHADLDKCYQKMLIPVQGILDILAQKEKDDEVKCQKILVLINPYSVAPADIAPLTVKETFPTTPFGHEQWVLPMGTVVVTSRALRIVPQNHRLLDASTKTSPETTVFMRIILEGLSGLARQEGLNSDEKKTIPSQRILTGEFLTYLHNRSELQDYASPNVRFRTDYQFRMLPYFEQPPFIEKVRNDVMKQVQINQYKTGLFLLFNQQNFKAASIAFANCEEMKYDKTLSEESRKMRFCSYLAAGAIPHLQEENKDNIIFPAYITQKTIVFDAPDGKQSTNMQKNFNLMPGDKIEVLEIKRLGKNNEQKVTPIKDIKLFDYDAWELQQNFANTWIHFKKKIIQGKKNTSNNRRRNSNTVKETEEIELEGWISAEKLNLVVLKEKQDKDLELAFDKIRLQLDKKITKEWNSSKKRKVAQNTQVNNLVQDTPDAQLVPEKQNTPTTRTSRPTIDPIRLIRRQLPF
ncbi:MAG: hypothetical protein LBE12_01920 [Planctomycetaceae bacterium]|nr:hypothetical protein [Planctomycetaceae bacterium]